MSTGHIDVSSLTVRECKWVMKQMGHVLPTKNVTVHSIQKQLEQILHEDVTDLGETKLKELVTSAHDNVRKEELLKRQARHNAILGRTTTTTTTNTPSNGTIQFRLPNSSRHRTKKLIQQEPDELDDDAELCDELERNLKLLKEQQQKLPTTITDTDDENPYYDQEHSEVRAYNVIEHVMKDGKKIKVYIAFGVCQRDVMKLRKELADYVSDNNDTLCKSNIRIHHNVHYTKHSEVLIVVKDVDATGRKKNDPIGFVSMEVNSTYCKIEAICALGNMGLGQYLITVAKNVSRSTLKRPIITLDALSNTIFFYRKLGFTNISPEELLVHRKEKPAITKLANQIDKKYSESANRVEKMMKDPLYEQFLDLVYRIDNQIPKEVNVYANGLYTSEYQMSIRLE